MKKNYQIPTLQVVQLQQQTQVLQASSEYVIPPGQPNEPPGAPAYRGQWDDFDWDDWDE